MNFPTLKLSGKLLMPVLTALSFLVMASGCVETFDGVIPEDPRDDKSSPEIKVDVNNFAEVDSTGVTRALQSGATTTFENGDAFGITFLDSRNNIIDDNIKYTYQNGVWSTTGSPRYRIAAKYIAYFPYSAACNGCKSESEVLAKLPVKPNQSSKNDYVASDVLYAEGLPAQSINISFRHTRACLSFRVEQRFIGYEYVVDFNVSDNIINGKVKKGTTEYISSMLRDGDYYRAIVEPGSNTYKVNFSYRGKSEEFDNCYPHTLTKGNRYVTLFKRYDDHLTADYIKVGDWVAINSSNKLEVIPFSLMTASERAQYFRKNKDKIIGKIVNKDADGVHATCTFGTFTYNNETFSAGYVCRNKGWIHLYTTYNRNWATEKPMAYLAWHRTINNISSNGINIGALDGRSGIELTNYAITKSLKTVNSGYKYPIPESSLSVYQYLKDLRNKFGYISSSLRDGTVNSIYYPGDRELSWPGVEGTAVLCVGNAVVTEIIGNARVNCYLPCLVEKGGTGSLGLRSSVGAFTNWYVLFDFKMINR